MVRKIAFDLTAIQPVWKDSDSKCGELYPGFCLPWFQDEPVMVSEVARKHRRGSGQGISGDEIRLDLKNRSRRTLAELWIAICYEADTDKSSQVSFSWTPPGSETEISVHFTEVIFELLKPYQCSETFISLVIPAALGPGPREQLLKKLNPLFKDIQFVQRPIALALEWCESPEAEEVLAASPSAVGEKVGFLCVSTACMDRWELSQVPIRIEEYNGEKYLCPVLDRTGNYETSVDLPFIGLIFEAAKNSLVGSDFEQVYRQLLYQTSQSDDSITGKRFVESSSLFEALPLVGWVSQSVGMSSAREKREKGPGDELSRRLTLIHSGIEQDGGLPHLLRAQIRSEENAVFRKNGVNGALFALDRIEQGKVPYFEAIRPLDLYVQEVNVFHDPVAAWQPLLEALEIPAGEDYRTPDPITDLEIPIGGQRELPLYLRRVKSGEDVTLFKSAPVRNDQDVPEPVEITARVRPGKGLSRVNIESINNPDLFSTSFFVDELEEKEIPPLVYSWPPGSAAVIVNEEDFFSLNQSISDFRAGRGGDSGISALREIKDLINHWNRIVPEMGLDERVPKPSSAETDSRFLYAGSFPSSKGLHTANSKKLVESLSSAIDSRFQGTRDDQTRFTICYTASWLYEDCPTSVLDFVRDKLRDPLVRRPVDSGDSPVHQAVLSVAGNCFTSLADYKLFFEALNWSIDNKCWGRNRNTIEWVRTYRNLTRFRFDSISKEALSFRVQEKIVSWYLDEFELAIQRSAYNALLHCSYLAPHVLKRRRFDPGFLDSNSSLKNLTQSVFEKALEVVNGSRRISVECAIEFLNKTANENTLTRLSSTEA